jgi:hypothetical protein
VRDFLMILLLAGTFIAVGFYVEACTRMVRPTGPPPEQKT